MRIFENAGARSNIRSQVCRRVFNYLLKQSPPLFLFTLFHHLVTAENFIKFLARELPCTHRQNKPLSTKVESFPPSPAPKSFGGMASAVCIVPHSFPVRLSPRLSFRAAPGDQGKSGHASSSLLLLEIPRVELAPLFAVLARSRPPDWSQESNDCSPLF